MNRRTKRRLLRLSVALASCAFVAQAYPSKPVRVWVGFAAGGGTDTAARMVAQQITESLG